MAKIKLNRGFKELFQLLNRFNVEYLLIGGYAVAYYGFVRATGDIDIWVNATEENDAKIKDALREFGLPIQDLPKQMFYEPGDTLRIGVPPVRIEILSAISGCDFIDAYPAGINEVFDDVAIKIIDLNSLRKNKAASGRPKDLADLDNLPKQP